MSAPPLPVWTEIVIENRRKFPKRPVGPALEKPPEVKPTRPRRAAH